MNDNRQLVKTAGLILDTHCSNCPDMKQIKYSSNQREKYCRENCGVYQVLRGIGSRLDPSEGKSTKWTKDEEAYLVAHVPVHGLQYVAKQLKKPIYTVRRKYNKMTSNSAK